ncbi:Uncharacterised protein [Bordetella ansorpii]|uniref:SGNH hydrolase-type esterase domain-containing protein n=1 Tax=Bordetella ansorpii TaxID=288768 RepID=A0A157RLP8_9BORD|nr:GDSL-type esterase/lipase family protein [Bordetella ansorpii]SAI58897.1 Uncharacterised protein [Bordetella ansorpii]
MATTYPTRQTLQDASQDAESLGKLLNDPVGAPNVNRAGNDLKNVATWYMEVLDSATSGGNQEIYTTYTQMLADTGQPVPTIGRVLSDPAPERRGFYSWNGPGGGGWVWLEPQPANQGDVDQLASDLAAKADQTALDATAAVADGALVAADAVERRTQGVAFRSSTSADEYGHVVTTVNGRALYGVRRSDNFLTTPKGVRAPVLDGDAVQIGAQRIVTTAPGATYLDGLVTNNGRLLWGYHSGMRTLVVDGIPLSMQRGMLSGDCYYVGDSILQYGIAFSGPNANGTSYAPCLSDQSWPGWALLYSNGRVQYAGQNAVAGYTADQVGRNCIPAALAAKPTFCVVSCGRNDVLQGLDVDLVTIPAFESIFRRLRQAGIIPVLCTMSAQGNGGFDTRRIAEHRINNYLRAYARRYGYPLVDMHRVTVDPATGDWRSGYSQDASHPNAAGARAMGAEFARVMGDWISPTEPIHADEQLAVGLSANVVPNALFLTASGGEADGWMADIAGDVAIETDPAVVGNVWRLGQAGETQRSLTVAVTSGASYTLGFYASVGNPALAQVYALRGGPTSTIHLGGLRRWSTPIDGMRYFSYEFTVTGGSTSATIVLHSNAADLRVAQLGIFQRVIR